MKNPKPTYEELMKANTLLEEKVDKLTRELSNELTDNLVQTSQIESKNKSLTVILERHHDLVIHHRRMESRYKIMSENINEAVSILDEKGIYIFANNKAADLHQLEIDEIIGKSFMEIMGPEIGERYRTEIFEPVFRSGVNATGTTAFDRGGKRMLLECTGQPLLDDMGTMIGILNITTDQTENKQREVYTEIEQQINFLSSLSKEIDPMLRDIFMKLCRQDAFEFGGVYIYKDKSKILELLFHYSLPAKMIDFAKSHNDQSQEYKLVMKGIPEYDCISKISKVSRDFFATIGVYSLVVIPLVAGSKVVGSLNLAYSEFKPFSEFRKAFIQNIAWRITSIISLHRTQEELTHTVGILNETISDLKIKQQMLIQKSKMESLGELSAGMAHEINQPLVIISLSIENILQKLNTRPGELSPVYLRKKFDAIRINLSRIQQIVDNLRIFARDQSGILFEKIDIRDIISTSIALIGPKMKADEIRVKLSGMEENIHILGNPFKLEQVFLNIFSNSIYAVNERSKSGDEPGFIRQIGISVTSEPDSVVIDVTDNGIGIQEDHLEKLFTPFFTTKMEGGGTGLGLPIVYGIVNEMNGNIRVTSKLNEFTNVRLSFPSL